MCDEDGISSHSVHFFDDRSLYGVELSKNDNHATGVCWHRRRGRGAKADAIQLEREPEDSEGHWAFLMHDVGFVASQSEVWRPATLRIVLEYVYLHIGMYSLCLMYVIQ